jgi:hypothetical protein
LKTFISSVALLTLSAASLSAVAQTAADRDAIAVVTLSQAGENYSPVAFLPTPTQGRIDHEATVSLAMPGENYSPVAFVPAPTQVWIGKTRPALSAQVRDNGTSSLSIGL